MIPSGTRVPFPDDNFPGGRRACVIKFRTKLWLSAVSRPEDTFSFRNVER